MHILRSQFHMKFQRALFEIFWSADDLTRALFKQGE